MTSKLIAEQLSAITRVILERIVWWKSKRIFFMYFVLTVLLFYFSASQTYAPRGQ